MNIKIRLCTVDDANSVCEINSRAFGYDFPAKETEKLLSEILLRKTDKLYAAENEDGVIGYIHVADYECTYSKPLKNIMAIAVLGEYRGQGIGRMLLQAAESWAKECGCEGVRLVSGKNRANAHQFYEHCGYKTRKIQKNFIKIFSSQ